MLYYGAKVKRRTAVKVSRLDTYLSYPDGWQTVARKAIERRIMTVLQRRSSKNGAVLLIPVEEQDVPFVKYIYWNRIGRSAFARGFSAVVLKYRILRGVDPKLSEDACMIVASNSSQWEVGSIHNPSTFCQ